MIKWVSPIAILTVLLACTERAVTVSFSEVADSELILWECSKYANEGDPNKEQWLQVHGQYFDKAKTLSQGAFKRLNSARVDAVEKLWGGSKRPGDTPDTYIQRQISSEKCKTSERTLLLFLKQIDEKRQF